MLEACFFCENALLKSLSIKEISFVRHCHLLTQFCDLRGIVTNYLGSY